MERLTNLTRVVVVCFEILRKESVLSEANRRKITRHIENNWFSAGTRVFHKLGDVRHVAMCICIYCSIYKIWPFPPITINYIIVKMTVCNPTIYFFSVQQLVSLILHICILPFRLILNLFVYLDLMKIQKLPHYRYRSISRPIDNIVPRPIERSALAKLVLFLT